MANIANNDPLLNVISRLSNLMQKENELLLSPVKNQELKQIIEEKKALTATYESHIQGLQKISESDSENLSIQESVKDALTSFQRLSEENTNRLLAKVEATKRVFNVIQKAVQDHQNSTNTYSNSGNLNNSARLAYAPPLSVGVNDEF